MLRIYLCWRGGDRGNLSVVLSPLMINWLPSSSPPLPTTTITARLAENTQTHTPTSSMFNNNEMWEESGRVIETGQYLTRLCSRRPPFFLFFFPEIVAKHKQCREIVLGQARTGYHLGFKFKQVFKTSQTQRDTANRDVSSLLMGLSPGENATSLSLILKL